MFPDIVEIQHNNTFYVKGDFVTISPEDEQRKIEYVFTRGNCHSFAVAACRLTGWQLYGMFLDGDDMAWHVVSRAPNGQFFDVTGFDCEHAWPRFTPRPITVKDIKPWVKVFENGGGGYVPLKVEATIPFVKKVLDNHGIPVKMKRRRKS